MIQDKQVRAVLERIHIYVDGAIKAQDEGDEQQLVEFTDGIEAALYNARYYMRHQEEKTA